MFTTPVAQLDFEDRNLVLGPGPTVLIWAVLWQSYYQRFFTVDLRKLLFSLIWLGLVSGLGEAVPRSERLSVTGVHLGGKGRSRQSRHYKRIQLARTTWRGDSLKVTMCPLICRGAMHQCSGVRPVCLFTDLCHTTLSPLLLWPGAFFVAVHMNSHLQWPWAA